MTDTPIPLPTPKPRIVLPPTCATCRGYHRGPQHGECRMLPPTGQILLEAELDAFKRPTGGQRVKTIAVHPPIPPTHWCRAHEPLEAQALPMFGAAEVSAARAAAREQGVPCSKTRGCKLWDHHIGDCVTGLDGAA